MIYLLFMRVRVRFRPRFYSVIKRTELSIFEFYCIFEQIKAQTE